ncbi:cell wall proline rich protein [Histoplasma capsulatum var. duboisii H88]|uniref:Cell wall proline rich protein n=3 Tax=Ajellomyces capsulatus TaxID=5037 RepID=A0A8A1LEJ6_AJEC8|nr:cell wall proline rich protein [Histoplasma capsulatum var. duboisii H88]
MMTSISPSSTQPQQLSPDSSSTSNDTQNPRRPSITAARPPQPVFAFPQHDPPSPSSNSSTIRSPAPLPAFSFPQAPDPAISCTSPPPTTPKLRPAGHRRRPSELNGGEIVGGLGPPMLENNVLPATLPLAAPGPGLSGPGPGRRGHQHRRSAAISSMDLTAVTKAFPPMPAGGSAPATPSDLRQQHALSEDIARPTSRSFPNLSTHTPPISPGLSLSIPDSSSNLHTQWMKSRPLSTISSEGSISTVRHYGHGSTASSAALTVTSEKPQTRPKTAGPSFDQIHLKSDSTSENPPQKRPLSASASVTGLTASPSDIPALPPFKKNIIEGYNKFTSGSISKIDPSPLPKLEPTASCQDRARTLPERKPSKKPKKMRSWAGILTRKAKKRSKKPPSRKAPTPPPILSRTNSEVGSMAEINFDDDNVIILRTPTLPDAPRKLDTTEISNDSFSLGSSWKPRSFYEQGTDSDMFSPVIDLDAALGPFNTPEMGSDRNAGSGFSAATKRMYSGGRRGEFVGPEMRYHRRAESAPEMPPFDRSALGLGRFGGTSTLTNPDVFYEEEEDAFLAESDVPASRESSPVAPNEDADRSSGTNSSATVMGVPPNNDNRSLATPGLGIESVDAKDLPTPVADTPCESTSSHPRTFQFADSPITPSSVAIEACGHSQNHQRSDDIEIIEVEGWPIPNEKPTIFPEKRPSTSPDYIYSMTPRTPIPDVPVPSLPSPNHSNISFEVPRLTTASSTMTDRDRHTFHSGYSMDHGASDYNYRHDSTEDVPSLTSSASTTTGTMSRFSSSFYNRGPGDRASSFSAATPRRTSRSNAPKRSSLVSLSKLVTGSTGEKSKLSYEEKAPRDDVEKSKKKGHRISRLMHFWKAKEKQRETD